MANHNSIEPFLVIPPGAHLADELVARGWTQSRFAAIVAVPPQSVNAVIRARREITPEFALKLEAAIGTSAISWLALEASYRTRLARERLPELGAIQNRAARASESWCPGKDSNLHNLSVTGT